MTETKRPSAAELVEYRAWIEGGLDEESPTEALTDLLAEIDVLTEERRGDRPMGRRAPSARPAWSGVGASSAARERRVTHLGCYQPGDF